MYKASERQKKYFFVLCRDLGYASEEAKERAKNKFKLEHFGDITSDQLSALIDLLLKKIEEQDKRLAEVADKKIIEQGWDTTICVSCGSECIVTDIVPVPTCTQMRCVRRYYANEIK